jgi:DNA-binding LacI/PurR family transcriptional regulator
MGNGPTMEDVARAAKVSRSLVSLVFQNSPKVSEQRRLRVQRAAAQLGYRPNETARRLASRASQTLGVLINDMHNPFFAEVNDGVEDIAEEFGYQLLLGTGRRDPKREVEFVATVLAERVEGLILLSPQLPNAALNALIGKVPTVIVGQAVSIKSVDCVVNDEEAGARLAVDHLISLGHQRIAHISGGSSSAGPARAAGFISAMNARGLAAEALVIDGDFTEAAGFKGGQLLLKRQKPPTAIFCANDLIAAGVIEALSSASFKVPRDFSIVGYDDSMLSRIGLLSLTTVSQPLSQMGSDAVKLLMERIKGGREHQITHVMEPELVVRKSTARIRAQKL